MSIHYRIIKAYLSGKYQDQPLVALARQIATIAHQGQKRKRSDDDYIIHPTRISARLRAAGASEIAQAAALLHDVIEDTEYNESRLRELFPQQVVDFVKALSKWWPDEHNWTGEAPWSEYIGNIKKNTDTAIIKIHDICDNIDDDRRQMIKLLNRLQPPVSGKDRERILKMRKGLFKFKSRNVPFAEEIIDSLEGDSSKPVLDAIKHYQTSMKQADAAIQMVADRLREIGVKVPENL